MPLRTTPRWHTTGIVVINSVRFTRAGRFWQSVCTGGISVARYGLTLAAVQAHSHAGCRARCSRGSPTSVLGVDAASEMVTAARATPAQDYSDRLSFVRVQTIARLALDDCSLDGVL